MTNSDTDFNDSESNKRKRSNEDQTDCKKTKITDRKSPSLFPGSESDEENFQKIFSNKFLFYTVFRFSQFFGLKI